MPDDAHPDDARPDTTGPAGGSPHDEPLERLRSEAVAGRAARGRLLLLVAGGLTALYGLLLLVLAALEVVSVDAARVSLGLSVAVFFVVVGAGLVLAGVAYARAARQARAPVVLTQLIVLGLAFNLRASEAAYLPWTMAALAVVGLVTALAPASTAVLVDGDPDAVH